MGYVRGRSNGCIPAHDSSSLCMAVYLTFSYLFYRNKVKILIQHDIEESSLLEKVALTFRAITEMIKALKYLSIKNNRNSTLQ